MTLEQLRHFYASGGAGDDLLQLLENVGQLLEEAGRKRISGELYRDLAASIEAMRRILDAWTDVPISLADASELLPGLLSGLLQPKDSGPQSVHLTVQALIGALYPAERCEELQIPFLVRNHEDSVPVPDVAVQVDVDSVSRPFIRFQRDAVDGHPIGLMEPGAEEQVNFVVDLSEDILGKVSDIKLDVLVRSDKLSIGEKAPRKRFTIPIRPTRRDERRNPYPTGLAVEPDHFIGRERELRQLAEAILGYTQDSVPVVVGIRRIGKTSLLKKLQADAEIERRFFTVYVSVEDRPDNDTSAQLLTYLATKIRDVLPEKYKKTTLFARDDFRHDPFAAFESFVDSITALDLPKRVLLIIDEFDRVLELIRDGQATEIGTGQHRLEPQILGALRKALMKNAAVRIIFAGLPAILQSRYEDRLFGLLLPIYVTPFSEQEGERVLDASNGVLQLTKRAREHLFRETGLQPYLLNLTCYYLFTEAQASGRDEVTLTDVQHVIRNRILPNENSFTDYLKLVGDNAPVLRAVAASERAARSRRFVSVSEIHRELQKVGEQRPIDELKSTLLSLAERERPLLRALGTDRYQMVIGMLGSYLIERQAI